MQFVPLHEPALRFEAATVPPVPADADTLTSRTKFAVHDFALVGFVNVIELPLCV
jgi:hypothetical protein